MEGKKKYIALILFLFIGLMIFTFANPLDNEEKKDDKSGISELSKGDKDSDTNKESDTNINDDNDTSVSNDYVIDDGLNQNTQLVSTENGNLTTGNTSEEISTSVDDSYQKALEAVKKAEDSLLESDLQSAKDLVEGLTDQNLKDELNSRLDEVQDSIEAKGLVETLEKMVSEAGERKDIEDSIDYRDESDVQSKVDALQNEALKEDLQERLSQLAKVLDDVSAPVITGVEDGAYTNSDVNLEITDDNEVKIRVTLNGEETQYESPFTSEGEYVVYVTDSAFNESKITFTIDKTAPSATITKSNNDKATNEDVVVTLTSDEVILTPEEWTKVSDTEFTKTYSENGKYLVIIKDRAGNEATINFEVKRIDKVAPEATITKSNNDKSTNKDVVVTLVANEAIYKPEGWTEVTTNKEHEFTKVYSENGKYSVTIKDKAGNETTINFEVKRIDKVAPDATVTLSNNGNSTNKDVVATLVANEAIYKPEGWTEVTTNKEHEFTKVYSENGKYSVTIKDKAGNEATINFEVKRIDKVAPDATVTLSNNGNVTNEDVVATLVANEAIYKPEGWTEVTTNKEHEFTKTYSENGSYSVTIKDKAGNETTIEFNVDGIDKVAPTLEVKQAPDSIVNNGVYSKISFKLHDNVGLAKVIVNGKEYARTGVWNDLNFQNVNNYVEGENVVVLVDLAGNETTFKFMYGTSISADDIVITSNNVYMYEGETTTLEFSVTPEDADVTLESTNEAIVSVNQDGTLVANKVGSTYVKIISGNITKEVFVVVYPTEITEVKVSAERTSLNPNETTTATAMVMPENASCKEVRWTSSDDSIATVDESGKITAVGVGQVTITATSTAARKFNPDMPNGDAPYGTITINVVSAPEFASDEFVVWADLGNKKVSEDGEYINFSLSFVMSSDLASSVNKYRIKIEGLNGEQTVIVGDNEKVANANETVSFDIKQSVGDYIEGAPNHEKFGFYDYKITVVALNDASAESEEFTSNLKFTATTAGGGDIYFYEMPGLDRWKINFSK